MFSGFYTPICYILGILCYMIGSRVDARQRARQAQYCRASSAGSADSAAGTDDTESKDLTDHHCPALDKLPLDQAAENSARPAPRLHPLLDPNAFQYGLSLFFGLTNIGPALDKYLGGQNELGKGVLVPAAVSSLGFGIVIMGLTRRVARAATAARA